MPQAFAISDAPVATGALSLYVTNLGPWSGGLTYRYLGNYPLSSGPCVNSAAEHDFGTTCANAPTPLGQVNAQGFGEWNLDVHYALSESWSLALGIYNPSNTQQRRRSFSTSIGCRTRSAPIRTAVPTSTSIRSNPSPPVLPSRNAFDTNRH